MLSLLCAVTTIASVEWKGGGGGGVREAKRQPLLL